MNSKKTNLLEVYIPFILVSIGTILFYTTFRWIFDLKLGILPLKDELLNFWIPFAFPWIPILIFLRRRIRILNVKGKRDNGYFIYQTVMGLAMTIPLIISQHYIEKSSFDLVELDSVEKVKELKNEKYFKIPSFIIDYKGSLPFFTARATGRNNETLNFHLYYSCPFEDVPSVWYGVKYEKSINNYKDEDQKNSEYRAFLEKSDTEFRTYNFKNAQYFEKLSYSDDKDGFIDAIKEKYPSIKEKEQIILIPKNDNFDTRTGDSFYWIFGSFGIGALIFLVMTLIPKIDQKEYNSFKKNRPLKDDDLKDILQHLDPRGPNKVTAILMLLNIIVFFVMVLSGINIISPTSKELLEFGGNRRFEVLSGDYWRLLSSIFIHGGVAHVFMNLFGLGIGGSLLEKILGPTKLLICYILCGLMASLGSIYWYDNTVSVGASGAIFGLFGLILAFTVYKIYPSYLRGTNWMLLAFYAGGSLLFGFLFPGIDNAAHLAGLISGFIIGGVLVVFNKEKLKEKAR